MLVLFQVQYTQPGHYSDKASLKYSVLAMHMGMFGDQIVCAESFLFWGFPQGPPSLGFSCTGILKGADTALTPSWKWALGGPM